MAVIYETGNHIAQLSDGRNRRRFAEVFIKEVTKAIKRRCSLASHATTQ